MRAKLYTTTAVLTLLSACAGRDVATPTAPAVAWKALSASYETGNFGRNVLRYTTVSPPGSFVWWHQGSASGPVQAGSYVTAVSGNNMNQVGWADADSYWWTDNTLYRFRFDHLTFGRINSSCNWSQTSYNPALQSAFYNGCYANFVESHYRIEKVRDEYPVAVSVSGPTTVGPGIVSYTASPSGGDGTYTYSWSYSVNGGASWSPACGTTSQCVMTVGSQSFLIQATVSSMMHSDPYGTFQRVYASSSLAVTVDQAVTVQIMGPQYIRKYVSCTWSALVSGTPPFSFSWTGRLSGSGSGVTGSFPMSGPLYVTVTDATGRTATAATSVEVTLDGPTSCQ